MDSCDTKTPNLFSNFNIHFFFVAAMKLIKANLVSPYMMYYLARRANLRLKFSNKVCRGIRILRMGDDQLEPKAVYPLGEGKGSDN